jgi:hypothetical protein
MNKKWFVVLLFLFATIAGAAIVITSAMSKKENPFVTDYTTCVQAGGAVVTDMAPSHCTYQGEIYHDGNY